MKSLSPKEVSQITNGLISPRELKQLSNGLISPKELHQITVDVLKSAESSRSKLSRSQTVSREIIPEP